MARQKTATTQKQAPTSTGLPSMHSRKPLSKDEELRLTRMAAEGNRDAEAVLVARNMGLVHDLARRYRSQGAAREDLIQEGTMGLLRAIRKFDPERGLRFSTYAGWWIRQGISRFVKGPTRNIRLPENIHDRIARVVRTREALRQGSDDPTLEDIAAEVGRTPKEVRKLLDYSKETTSLDAPVLSAPDRWVGDSLESSGRAPEDEAASRAARGAMISSLANLPGRQTWILAHRYGLADGQARSRPWIGRKLGLSAERVRQLEQQALTTLREGMR